MKKTLTFLTALILVCNSGYSQWTSKDFGAKLSYCWDILFIDAHTGFIVGDYTDPNTQVDYSRIYRTTNDGTTWTKVFEVADGVDYYNLSSIYFTTSSIGFVVGKKNQIVFICKTTDGGATWTSTTEAAVFNASTVFFPSASVGYVAGDFSSTNMGIIKTTDGGATWTNISQAAAAIMNGAILDIHFLDNNTGFAVTVASFGNPGGIYKTTDGGTTWTQKFLAGNTASINSIHFIDATNGFACGTTGDVFKTTDGGNNWTNISLQISDDVHDVYFFTSQLGYVASGGAGAGGLYGGVYKTTNGGTSWTLDCDGSPNVYLTCYALSFAVGIGYTSGISGYARAINAPMDINETPQTYTNLVIYPNPSEGHYKIELEGQNNCNVEVYDVIGNLVLQNKYNDMRTIEFDLTSQSSGMYYLKLTTENGNVVTSKISKN